MWPFPRGEEVRRFTVLIVDDDERILNFLRVKLRASGYDVATASDGREGLEQIQGQEPDLVVLDVIMPRLDGIEALRELRSFSTVPVIILTARGDDGDRIRGLRMGADDYLPKPFNPDELVARIEAVRRRSTRAGGREGCSVFSAAGMTVDFDRRGLYLNGEEKYLTRIEWLLLSELTRNAGRLLPYEELLTRIWGVEYRDDIQLLRTWISRLRGKLEGGSGQPRLIRTLPKAGYIMDSPAPVDDVAVTGQM